MSTDVFITFASVANLEVHSDRMTFTLCTPDSRNLVEKDGRREYEDHWSYYDCVIWTHRDGKLTDLGQRATQMLINKIQLCMAKAHLKQQRWEKDGKKHSRVELTVTDFRVHTSKEDADKLRAEAKPVVATNVGACGHPIPAGAVFCPTCGARQGVTCSNGHTVPTGAVFCPTCGERWPGVTEPRIEAPVSEPVAAPAAPRRRVVRQSLSDDELV